MIAFSRESIELMARRRAKRNLLDYIMNLSDILGDREEMLKRQTQGSEALGFVDSYTIASDIFDSISNPENSILTKDVMPFSPISSHAK